MTKQQTEAAVVIGASGGIGRALADALEAPGLRVWRCARSGDPAVDVTDDASVAAVAEQVRAEGLPIWRLIVASGFLHGDGVAPEKSWRDLDGAALAHAFAVNATGPALVLKHFLPLLPRDARTVVACLSARVGSIGDNNLGGWHAYRASKSALNQIVHTCAIELKRKRPDAVLAAIHPGTVATGMSAPFAKNGLDVRPPDTAAAQILSVLDGLTPKDSGGFFDHTGAPIPW